VVAHYIFHRSTVWVRPIFTELGPKNPHFAKKQTNICRLSGDIIIVTVYSYAYTIVATRVYDTLATVRWQPRHTGVETLDGATLFIAGQVAWGQQRVTQPVSRQ